MPDSTANLANLSTSSLIGIPKCKGNNIIQTDITVELTKFLKKNNNWHEDKISTHQANNFLGKHILHL